MKRSQWSIFALLAVFLGNAAQGQFLVTEKEIRRQARVEWLQMKRHMVPEPDARVVRYVQCVADSIIAQLPAEHQNIDWEVVVFDQEEPNAFADPNGKIGVFNGILQVANTPDALAAVIGHEVAHATEGHVMQRARKSARQEVWAMLGGAATGATDVWRQSIAIGFGFPFAREQEAESDLVGLDYMANAGFDPRASVNLWKNYAEMHKTSGRQRPPEFLSTHPSDSARIDNMIRSLTPALIKYNAAREAGKRPACAAPN